MSHFVLQVASLIALFFCWSFSWGRAGRVLRWKRQKEEDTLFPRGIVFVSVKVAGNLSASRGCTGSYAAHEMPVSILKKEFSFNKEKHSWDHVWSLCLKKHTKNRWLRDEMGSLGLHSQQCLKNSCKLSSNFKFTHFRCYQHHHCLYLSQYSVMGISPCSKKVKGSQRSTLLGWSGGGAQIHVNYNW